jgi:hypothetical protein
VVQQIFKNLSTLQAHLAVELLENDSLTQVFDSPKDLAIVCHDNRIPQCDLFKKMLEHLVLYGYLEEQGGIFTLADDWRRILPSEHQAQEELRKSDSYSLYLFQKMLAKHFLDVVRNDAAALSLEGLVYYLDTIDGCGGLDQIRAEAINQLMLKDTPQRIFDYQFGFGYSSRQLAVHYPESTIYSLQLNTVFRYATDFTISRLNAENIIYENHYPSSTLNKLMQEKVDIIFGFNPLGIIFDDYDRFLNVANQIAKEETIILLYSPVANQPGNNLICEWLASAVEDMDEYPTYEHLKIILRQNGFEVEDRINNRNYVIGHYCEE